MLITGYFTRIAWQSFVGSGLLVSGYGLALLDVFLRKKRRDDASTFHIAAIVSPIVGVFLLVLTGFLGAIVLLIHSWIYGYSSTNTLRLLHFLGILYAFIVVTGIVGLASRGAKRRKTDQRQRLAHLLRQAAEHFNATGHVDIWDSDHYADEPGQFCLDAADRIDDDTPKDGVLSASLHDPP